MATLDCVLKGIETPSGEVIISKLCPHSEKISIVNGMDLLPYYVIFKKLPASPRVSLDPDQTPQNGSGLFALNTGISIKHDNNKTNQTLLLLEKWTCQKPRVEDFIRQKWVNEFCSTLKMHIS